jgi:ankyrin repeat protein
MEAGEAAAGGEAAYEGLAVVWVDGKMDIVYCRPHGRPTSESSSDRSDSPSSHDERGSACDGQHDWDELSPPLVHLAPAAIRLARKLAAAIEHDSTGGVLLAAREGWLLDDDALSWAVQRCLEANRPRCLRALAWACEMQPKAVKQASEFWNAAMACRRNEGARAFVIAFRRLLGCAAWVVEAAESGDRAAVADALRAPFNESELPDVADGDPCAALCSREGFAVALQAGAGLTEIPPPRRQPDRYQFEFDDGCELGLTPAVQYAAARRDVATVRALVRDGHVKVKESKYSHIQLGDTDRSCDAAAQLLCNIAPLTGSLHQLFEGAVQYGCMAAIESAIERLIHCPSTPQKRALWMAVQCGDAAAAQMCDYDVIECDPLYGEEGIWRAVVSGCPSALRFVTERSDKKRFEHDTRTVLLALEKGEPIKHLLLAAKCTEENTHYCTPPLLVACALGAVDCVGALLDAGADVNAGFVTRLQRRPAGGYWPVDNQRESPADKQLVRETTALRVAAVGGHIECVRLLLRRGASLTPLVDVTSASGAPLDADDGSVIWDEDVDTEPPAKGEAVPAVVPAEHVDVVAVLLVRHARDSYVEWMRRAYLDEADAKGRASMWRPLHWAVEDDDAGAVAALAPLLARADLRDWQHRTPLHLAAEAGRTGAVALLVAAGADVGAATADGSTSLHLAAAGGHVEAATALLAGGSSVAAADGSGRTPLHAACRAGHVAVTAALVGAGADAAATSRWGWTALHHAAAGGSGTMVRWLLDAGASVGAADAFGSESLHVAAEWGGVEAIGVLCAGGAGVNRRNGVGASPLRLAVMQGRAAAATALATAGALLDAASEAGVTPLADAVRCGHADVAAALLSAGARVTAPGVGGGGAADVVSVSLAGQPVDVTRRLARGLLLGVQSGVPSGETAWAVHAACAGDCLPALEALAAAGANLEAAAAQGWDRWTPLHAAARWGAADCVRWLLARGVEVPVDASSLVDAAIASGSGACVIALLQASPACVPADLRGLWPTLSAQEQAAVVHRMALYEGGAHLSREQLMLAACQADDAAAVAALAKDASLVNSGKQVESSPLHVAIEAGAARAVEALVRAGANVHRTATSERWRSICALQLAAELKRASIAAVLLHAGARLAHWPVAPYAAMPEELLRGVADAVVEHPKVSLVAAVVRSGSADVLRWLVQHGCCTDAAIVANAVEVAASLGRMEHLEMLLGTGVSRVAAGRALEAAVYHGSVHAIRLLLGCGAPCPPAQRGALLMSAVPHVEHSEEVVSLLLDTFGDEAALHDHGVALLCACFRHKNAAMALRLVRAGVNVGVPLGEMPEEAARQLPQVVRSDLQLRAKTVLADLLFAACRAGCVELLSWVVGRGVPQSALHHMLSEDKAYDAACLERLLAADAAVPPAVLSRALEVACKRSSPEAVRVLLRRGAAWASVEQAKTAVKFMAEADPHRPVGVWLEMLAGGVLPQAVWSTEIIPLLAKNVCATAMAALLAHGVPVRLQLPSGSWGEPVDASADAEWAAGILQASRGVAASAVLSALASSGGVASFLRLRGWGLWPHLAQCLHDFVERERADGTLLLLAAGADPLESAGAGGSSAYALMCTPIHNFFAQSGRPLFADADRDGILLAVAGVMRWRRRRWPIVACSLWGDEWWADVAAAAGVEEGGGVGHKRRGRPGGGGGEEEWYGPPAAKRAPPASGDGE